MRVVSATTFTIATTVTSRIAEILHNTVSTRHIERYRGQPGKVGGLGHVKNRRSHIWGYCGRLRSLLSFLDLQKAKKYSMSDFGFSSSSSSSSSGGMNGAQRAELMEQVQNQLMVATLQDMLAVSFEHRA